MGLNNLCADFPAASRSQCAAGQRELREGSPVPHPASRAVHQPEGDGHAIQAQTRHLRHHTHHLRAQQGEQVSLEGVHREGGDRRVSLYIS